MIFSAGIKARNSTAFWMRIKLLQIPCLYGQGIFLKKIALSGRGFAEKRYLQYK